MVAGPLPAPPPGRYGWDRIVAGARFLSDLDPGWWREDALPPASLAALDMADPYRCVLAWWAAQRLPAPPRGPRQVAPYDRAVRALRLSSQQAQALGFTGVDADLLTPGWRHLITCLRASCDRRAAVDPVPAAVQSRGVLPAQRLGRGTRLRRRAASSREEPQHGAAPPCRGYMSMVRRRSTVRFRNEAPARTILSKKIRTGPLRAGRD
jgi:hypothetical protein